MNIQSQIMDEFRSNPRMTVSQIRAKLGLTVKQANNALTRLRGSGKIKHVDNATYQVPIPIVVKPSTTAWGIAMSLLAPVSYIEPEDKKPVCEICGTEFTPAVHNSKTCSDACSRKKKNRSKAQRRKAARESGDMK